MKLEEVKDALNRYFDDKRPRAETREGLEELGADIELMLSALDDDERREQTQQQDSDKG